VVREQAHKLPPEIRTILTQDRPIDFRDVPIEALSGSVSPRRAVWFRVMETLPDQPIMHQAILAYASDYGLLPTALMPHAMSYRDPRIQLASLDHTLWMHRPFRADEWLLYAMESPSASGARGFVLGRVFTQSGVLVASVAQEGLIRLRDAV
jgi:acyl-CoA thioesterase-2